MIDKFPISMELSSDHSVEISAVEYVAATVSDYQVAISNDNFLIEANQEIYIIPWLDLFLLVKGAHEHNI